MKIVAVLDFIKKHGQITKWEAMKYLSVFDLNEQIKELRKLGYNIKEEWTTSVTEVGISYFPIYSL